MPVTVLATGQQQLAQVRINCSINQSINQTLSRLGNEHISFSLYGGEQTTCPAPLPRSGSSIAGWPEPCHVLYQPCERPSCLVDSQDLSRPKGKGRAGQKAGAGQAKRPGQGRSRGWGRTDQKETHDKHRAEGRRVKV